ncbi:MAG: MFS transporter, partial [Chloroflexota bacterium]
MKNQSALYAMAMGNFTIGIGSFIISGIINPIAAEFSVSLELVGFLITYYALAYAIGSPLLIWWSGNSDRRALLIGGLALAVLGNLFAAVAPNYGLMVVARVVQA